MISLCRLAHWARCLNLRQADNMWQFFALWSVIGSSIPSHHACMPVACELIFPKQKGLSFQFLKHVVLLRKRFLCYGDRLFLNPCHTWNSSSPFWIGYTTGPMQPIIEISDIYSCMFHGLLDKVLLLRRLLTLQPKPHPVRVSVPWFRNVPVMIVD